MSQSSLESQVAEKTEMQDQDQGNLALSNSDFSALEERVARTVKLVKIEREARAAAERRAESLDTQLTEQLAIVKTLHEEVRVLNTEREQVRKRVERLLTQLDSLQV